MRAQIVCRVRSGTILTFAITGNEAVIGRDARLGVAIPMEGVSRQHARIVWDGRSHWIEDLESTNGTFLNGQPAQRERLRHFDVITLGKNADLLFLLRTDEPLVVRKQGIVRAALIPESPDALPWEIPTGEVTLGRSSAANIVAEHGAVSKLHAKIERTTDQLVLRDLGSSNGTFVNGVRVTTSLLNDGDALSLASVESYRVVVEMGEITAASGARVASAGAPGGPEEERPRFSADWKTRFEWDAEELKVLAEVQRQHVGRGTLGEKHVDMTIRPDTRKRPVGVPTPTPAPPSRPGPRGTTAPGVPPGRAKPAAAPAKAAPAAPPAQAAPSAPAAQARPAAPPGAASAPAPPAPATPAAELPTVYARPAAPPSVPAAPPAPVSELRLTGSGHSFAVTAAGTHDLGRSKDAALQVSNPTVSRRHARIILTDDRTTASIQDMGGANGTQVNGVTIQEARPLSDGDVIQIGEVQLVVSIKR